MKYLITGGAGFIGSHLAERLLREGHDVTVIDDLSTGNMRNLQGVSEHPRFRFVLGSVEDSYDLGTLVTWADTIFHLAATVGVDLVVKEPVRTIETNVHGTEQVLRYAALGGKRLFLASTSEVYGRAASEVFSETDDLLIGPPTHSRWAYAASKALDEYLTLAYHREGRISATVLRFFNTVGPRQTGRYGMVLPRFVGRSLRNEPLQVFGNGEQSRCFCHVLDTVEAMIRLEGTSGSEGTIVNVGSQASITINQLANRVVEQLGSHSRIEHVPYSEAYAPGFEDMHRRMPDIRTVQELTGWQPQRELHQIISEVRADIESQTGFDDAE